MNNNYTPTREELLQHGKVIMDTDNNMEGATEYHYSRLRLIELNGIRYLMRERNDIALYIKSFEELEAIYGKED